MDEIQTKNFLQKNKGSKKNLGSNAQVKTLDPKKNNCRKAECAAKRVIGL